jgi:serine/threonine protein kinase
VIEVGDVRVFIRRRIGEGGFAFVYHAEDMNDRTKTYALKRLLVRRRVARWFLFEPKIPICVNFGGSSSERCWYILCPFGEFSGRNMISKYFLMKIFYVFFSSLLKFILN